MRSGPKLTFSNENLQWIIKTSANMQTSCANSHGRSLAIHKLQRTSNRKLGSHLSALLRSVLDLGCGASSPTRIPVFDDAKFETEISTSIA
jgi:hypothetical protein